ncbi:MAG: hypothetical protein AB1505_26445 [Candidatus Latescibacterota bacterium]
MQRHVQQWLSLTGGRSDRLVSPHYHPPLTERLEPPWWHSVPRTGDEHFAVAFRLSSPSEVSLLMRYAGSCALHLDRVEVYRVRYEGPRYALEGLGRAGPSP